MGGRLPLFDRMVNNLTRKNSMENKELPFVAKGEDLSSAPKCGGVSV